MLKDKSVYVYDLVQPLLQSKLLNRDFGKIKGLLVKYAELQNVEFGKLLIFDVCCFNDFHALHPVLLKFIEKSDYCRNFTSQYKGQIRWRIRQVLKAVFPLKAGGNNGILEQTPGFLLPVLQIIYKTQEYPQKLRNGYDQSKHVAPSSTKSFVLTALISIIEQFVVISLDDLCVAYRSDVIRKIREVTPTAQRLATVSYLRFVLKKLGHGPLKPAAERISLPFAKFPLLIQKEVVIYRELAPNGFGFDSRLNEPKQELMGFSLKLTSREPLNHTLRLSPTGSENSAI